MASFRVVVAIAVRFLRQQVRNKTAIAMLVIVPLLIAGILGFADQRSNTRLPVGVFIAGSGALSDQLAEQLAAGEGVSVDRYDTRDDLNQAIRVGDVAAGVEIPVDYDAVVMAGADASPDVIGAEDKSTFVAARADIVFLVAQENALLAEARKNIDEGATTLPLPEELAKVRAQNGEHTIAPPTRIRAEKGSHAYGLGRYTAGMLVFFIFDSAMFHAAIFRDDRRRGIFARMSTSPNRASVILAGEITGRAILGIAQGFIIVLAGALLFGLDWGNPLGVTATIIAFTFMATGAGILVGVIGTARTVAETESATAGLIAVLGLIGGCFWPLFIVPDWLRVVAHFSPHAWANDNFDTLLATSGGLAQIWVSLVILTALAAVLFGIAVANFQGAVRR
jgi:ABC-2 type transport system permease protein